jgi:translocator protein
MRKASSSLLTTSAAVATAAVVGGVGTDVRSAWYRRLDKPSWQPPGSAFGIAWTVLYVLLAVAGARALDRAEQSANPAERRRYLRSYAVNLVLNAGWSWIFFRAKRPRLAVAEVVLLLASTVELTGRTFRLDRAAGTALLPYAGWTSFATALSAEIARRNRPGS